VFGEKSVEAYHPLITTCLTLADPKVCVLFYFVLVYVHLDAFSVYSFKIISTNIRLS
jgi:hypothetical protein